MNILKKQKNYIDMLLVSLTSYPARINTVNQTIESLLNQTVKPDKIILWLSIEEFPNKEKELPKQLLDLIPKGLTIDWCQNVKSYNKLIPVLKKYPNSFIITADDDIIYNENCIKSLIDTYKKYPKCIITNRAHYITFTAGKINKYCDWHYETKYKKQSFNMLQTGVGAVLYPPKSLYKDVLKKELFIKLSQNSDDIWFWAMAVLNNTKIKLAEPNYDKLHYIDGTQNEGLWYENCCCGNNDKNIKLVLEHYPKILKKLEKKNKTEQSDILSIFSVIKKIIFILKLKLR